MRFYIMTLISVIAVLALKSYTINAQDKNVDDMAIEIMASGELLNKADTIRHQKMISRFVKVIEKSEYVYGKYTGSAEFPNQVFQNYERLEHVGTVQELSKLLEHESAIVRVYAHKAIVANDMKVAPLYLDQLVSDTSEVVCIDGLSISKSRVMDIVAQDIFQ